VTVTVTWLDGTQENYCCDSWYVKEGVLYLAAPRNDASQPKRAIPTRNVRIWTE
jgi:hypothetical protein